MNCTCGTQMIEVIDGVYVCESEHHSSPLVCEAAGYGRTQGIYRRMREVVLALLKAQRELGRRD